LIFPEGIKLFLLTVLDLMTTAIVTREPESFSVFQFTFSDTHSNHRVKSAQHRTSRRDQGLKLAMFAVMRANSPVRTDISLDLGCSNDERCKPIPLSLPEEDDSLFLQLEGGMFGMKPQATPGRASSFFLMKGRKTVDRCKSNSTTSESALEKHSLTD
jgi:hypothetical protein